LQGDQLPLKGVRNLFEREDDACECYKSRIECG
jgi:hypothetical protein